MIQHWFFGKQIHLVKGITLCSLAISGLSAAPLTLHAQTPAVKPSPATSPKPTTPAAKPSPKPVASPALPSTSDVTITIDGLRNTEGQVCINLFASANATDFPTKAEVAVRKECTKVTTIPMRVVLKGLQPGTYALNVLHDANMDGKPNRVDGIPGEGFGFSQNPPLNLQAPKFADTSFEVKPPRMEIRVQINYLK
jgi:uncharacterized protein (DUF2141 family)